jgi:hypothetical protein
LPVGNAVSQSSVTVGNHRVPLGDRCTHAPGGGREGGFDILEIKRVCSCSGFGAHHAGPARSTGPPQNGPAVQRMNKPITG